MHYGKKTDVSQHFWNTYSLKKNLHLQIYGNLLCLLHLKRLYQPHDLFNIAFILRDNCYYFIFCEKEGARKRGGRGKRQTDRHKKRGKQRYIAMIERSGQRKRKRDAKIWRNEKETWG